MKKWTSIEELIEILASEREELSLRLDALSKPPTSFGDEVLLKYIETRSTVKASEHFKSKGVRSLKGTVYSPADVSTLVTEGGEGANEVLLRIARDIFKKNTKGVVRAYG
jgi:hypothetical protein